jgi:signal transduction histidine kinase
MRALNLGPRLDRAARALGYIAVSIPLSVLALVFLGALLLGATLSVVGLGIPVLLAAAGLSRWLARVDRQAANRLLGTQVPPLPLSPRGSGSPWRRALDVMSDRWLWRIFAVLAVKPPLAAGMLAVAIAPILLLAELIILGGQGLFGLHGVDYVGPWQLGPGLGIALLVLAVPVAVLCVAVLEGLQTVICTVTHGLLAPRATTATGPVREMLAESLGDRSLSIAYWVPARQAFVDEAGDPVDMPEPGSGRTWTAVESDGQRVAAIVHDAALDTSPELVHAAAAGASLALDNERLKADLRARVQELRISRRRIVEAGDEARKRIERDLHDGAQQHLVGLALELRLLRSRVSDPAVLAEIDRLNERLGMALAELRELARGIHPAVLTTSGLEPAIRLLADRVGIPIECEVEVEGRLDAPVEAAAYFVVAEGLTNVAKYAQATHATVRLACEDGHLVVEVRDDGVGGASADSGSGLSGLADRVGAADGTLSVESPPGAGTLVRAVLPLKA